MDTSAPIDHIYTVIIVKKEGRIMEKFLKNGALPGTVFYIFCPVNVELMGVVAVEAYLESPLMIPQTGRPGPLAVNTLPIQQIVAGSIFKGIKNIAH